MSLNALYLVCGIFLRDTVLNLVLSAVPPALSSLLLFDRVYKCSLLKGAARCEGRSTSFIFISSTRESNPLRLDLYLASPGDPSSGLCRCFCWIQEKDSAQSTACR